MPSSAPHLIRREPADDTPYQISIVAGIGETFRLLFMTLSIPP